LRWGFNLHECEEKRLLIEIEMLRRKAMNEVNIIYVVWI